jgi:DNA repair photolyase
MAGDTFSGYYGEFCLSPVPVELSFNWCSHNCGYCFANLNQPKRKAAIQSTMNMLEGMEKRSTFEAYLLREKYPVLLSNRVDPVASSNYKQALPIIKELADRNIPMAFQTKGGKGIDECLDMIEPSAWYVSINSLDEEYRQKMEPGAPSFDERFNLIEKLVSRGHYVSVGLNPAVPEWLPEPAKLVERIAASGAYGVWCEPLHFNTKQLAVMPEHFRSQFSDKMIARAKKRILPAEYKEFLDSIDEAVIDSGMEIFRGDYPKPSKYWEPYAKLYPKRFPTNQEFINHLVAKGVEDGTVLSIDQYIDFMSPQLPKGEMRLGHYIGATSRQVCRDDPNWSNYMSYEDLLRYMWRDGRIKMALVRNQAFSYCCVREDGELLQVFDENEEPLLVFSTQGFDNYQVEV